MFLIGEYIVNNKQENINLDMLNQINKFKETYQDNND